MNLDCCNNCIHNNKTAGNYCDKLKRYIPNPKVDICSSHTPSKF